MKYDPVFGTPFTYRVAQKKVSHHQFFKKSYERLPTRLDIFVKLKYESSTIIQSVGNKYNNARAAKYSDMRHMQ